jgi:hypothetical protein
VLIDNGAVNRDSIGYVTNAKVLAELKKLRAGGSTTTDGAYLVNDSAERYRPRRHSLFGQRLPAVCDQPGAEQPDQGLQQRRLLRDADG